MADKFHDHVADALSNMMNGASHPQEDSAAPEQEHQEAGMAEPAPERPGIQRPAVPELVGPGAAKPIEPVALPRAGGATSARPVRTVRRVAPAPGPTLEYKKTLIPILLTLTACTAVTGLLHWLAPESFFGDAPAWFSYLMFGLALPFLCGGVMMMMAVRDQLQTMEQKK